MKKLTLAEEQIYALQCMLLEKETEITSLKRGLKSILNIAKTFNGELINAPDYVSVASSKSDNAADKITLFSINDDIEEDGVF